MSSDDLETRCTCCCPCFVFLLSPLPRFWLLAISTLSVPFAIFAYVLHRSIQERKITIPQDDATRIGWEGDITRSPDHSPDRPPRLSARFSLSNVENGTKGFAKKDAVAVALLPVGRKPSFPLLPGEGSMTPSPQGKRWGEDPWGAPVSDPHVAHSFSVSRKGRIRRIRTIGVQCLWITIEALEFPVLGTFFSIFGCRVEDDNSFKMTLLPHHACYVSGAFTDMFVCALFAVSSLVASIIWAIYLLNHRQNTLLIKVTFSFLKSKL